MLARVLLVAVAVVAASYGIGRLQHVDRCDDAVQAATSLKRGAPGADGVADRALANCADPRQRATVAAALIAVGDRATANRMAHTMTAEQPDDYRGWILREIIASLDGYAALSRAMYDRGAALNPRGVPALPRGAQ